MESEEVAEREKRMIEGIKRLESELGESHADVERLSKEVEALHDERESFVKISKGLEKRIEEQHIAEQDLQKRLQTAIDEV
jgi:regulator of replication initiation timing